MKKLLLLVFVCMVSTHIIAQKTTTEKAEKPTLSAIPANDIAPPPPPPPPPEPPTPPPMIQQVKYIPIVNDKGYNLSVHYNNGKNMVHAWKNGVSEKISMDKWNANRSYYEKKYGELPAPPPPPPAPPAPPSE